MKLVETVPNFSEGRRKDVIEKIVNALSSVKGAHLLDYTSDPDHNRSVVTLIGEPDNIMEALFRGTQKTTELIDLTRQQGAHPRIGAMDVIPFIPYKGITINECIELSKSLGKRIAEELKIPVYLYAYSAATPARKRLPDVRKGEFEGLIEGIKLPERHPDFGKPVIHPTAGATAVGARKFLIAYNINLDTREVKIAEKIAQAVRETSGGLVNVQAKGLWLKDQEIVQVTMNLMDFEVTPIYRVYELVKIEAQRYGVEILESEIIGLPPIKSLLQSLSYYLKIRGKGYDFSLEERLTEKLLE
ncbi:MAG: Glutamate formimidoyltransferase [candidate division WS2 bacterium]|nr:Glutamate formimidoyltransferase [Candidatus Lithacetigena glycinireducens]